MPARWSVRANRPLVPYAGWHVARDESSPIRFNGIRDYPISALRMTHPDKNVCSVNTECVTRQETSQHIFSRMADTATLALQHGKLCQDLTCCVSFSFQP